jgi:GDPmannose 4,6-dehydratase
MAKTALVTGITGQDGSYLARLLLKKGYVVHGLRRRCSIFNTERIDSIYFDPHSTDVRLLLHYGDMTDSTNIIRVIQECQPDEIYNLAAQSHVAVSFHTPEYTGDADGLGVLRICEAIRLLGLIDKTRLFQASTSELFGKVQAVPQNEETPFYPRSPYAVAKLYGFWTIRNHREAYGLFGCNGIFFNHESPRRGETFVTRKITRAVAAIALARQPKLYLGNLSAQRDWGHAGDYVQAMHLILQQDEPDDYVIATGRTTTVRDFARMAFGEIGLEMEFSGEGAEETGCIASIDAETFTRRVGIEPAHLQTGQCLIQVDPRYYRPSEVDLLIGDSTKARTKLGWQPMHSLEELVAEMVAADVDTLRATPLDASPYDKGAADAAYSSV